MLYATSRLRKRSTDHVGHFAAVIEKKNHSLLERKTTKLNRHLWTQIC